LYILKTNFTKHLYLTLLFCSGLNGIILSQVKLTIHQTGIKNHLYPDLIIAEYPENATKKINDSTLLFTAELKEQDCLFIGIDRSSRWFTRIWIKPETKEKSITIDYKNKTIETKKPDEWDLVTEKVMYFDSRQDARASDSVSAEYLYKHPESYLSLWMLSHGMYRDNRTEKVKAFKALSSSLSHYPEYKQTKADLFNRNYPKEGDAFKEFTLEDIKGKTFNTSSINSKWIFLNFWSTGCAPCVKEMDELVQLYKSIDKTKIEFISISLDEKKENWKKGKSTAKIIWPNVWQNDNFYGELCLYYNILAMPSFVLFNKEKKLVFIKDGSNELEGLKKTLSSIK